MACHASKQAEPVEVSGDRDRLRQVFDNLLANVRAHTPAGHDGHRRGRSGRRRGRRVDVADNGPGMTATSKRPALFERFYRADPSRSRASGGAGLGLSIVAAIVAAHGGTVVAAPVDGGGAAFTVRLPVDAAPAAKAD